MQNPDAIEIEFNSSVVLEKNAKATTKIVANEGGSRSTKTYSIAQLLIGTGISSPYPIEITISRKRLTWLRDTAMKDFFDILTQYNLYFPRYHNKTTNSYQLYNGHFAFTGLDEPQKLRGRKQHIFWLNEANEATKEDFLQVELRTSQKIYLDYNPSDEYHWLYETVIPRPDCTLIKSTFLDNPYLDPELKKTILRLKEADATLWSIYGLGERARNAATIYNHHQVLDHFPEFKNYCYGLDFGFNAETALVKVGFHDKGTYWKQMIYQTHLTTPEIIRKLAEVGVKKNDEIYADHADPEKIEQIYRAGYNIHNALKDVKNGIDTVKSNPLYFHIDDVHLLKEARNYKWKQDKNGKILDEPVDFMDHLMDAGRYGTHSKLRKPVLSKPKFTLIRR